MKFGTVATAICLTLKSTQAFVVNNRNVAALNRISMTQSETNVDVVPASVSPASTNTELLGGMSPDFEAAMTQVTSALTAVLETPSMEAPLVHFTREYFTACDDSSKAGNEKITAQVAAKNMMNAMQYAMKFGLNNKYIFGVTHKALRGQSPEDEEGNEVDFYNFGCDFFRPAIDSEKSIVLGEESLAKAAEQLKKGENVVFFANHQSEADPQVMSILMEKAGYGKEAEELIYVAGHKVTTDILAIPFSMGRNLICIHSKKHIDADPDTKNIKQKQNLAAMTGMLKMKKKGGACIWVAPSGGRDRRDLETGKVPIAPFDQKTIDMFRLMGNKSKVPTHYYSVSMVSYDLCPPPDTVEAGTGEQRNVRFVPVAIKINEELDNVGGVESRHLFTEQAFETAQQGYEECLKALGQE
jgi:glycerol-3-phosphate O-acyltransferase